MAAPVIDNVLAAPAAPPPPQIMQISSFITAPEVYKMLVAVGEAKISASYFKVGFSNKFE